MRLYFSYMKDTIGELPGFDDFSPDAMIGAVEDAVGESFTALASPLPSYINRVFEFMSVDSTRYVAKFYRPGRWSRAAIEEEHEFVLDCAADEIPVVPPLELRSGRTLGEVDGISFAVYPKRSGREMDLDTDEAWFRLGSLVARIHNVGARKESRCRLYLRPESTTLEEIRFLLEGGFVPKRMGGRFEKVCEAILAAVTRLFDGLEYIRIHGDCHRANILERPGEGLMVIDFDDMMVGPPIQDLWLLLPARADCCRREIGLLLDGYEMFREFDCVSLRLIEPLRAMRMIYFLAWCARQSGDYNFQSRLPGWGEDAFWMSEIADLEAQLGAIREADSILAGRDESTEYSGRILTEH